MTHPLRKLEVVQDPEPTSMGIEGIDFDELQEILYGDGDDPPPSQERIEYRHQLMNPDFWFFAGSTIILLLTLTSFIGIYALETMIVASLLLNGIGIVANLTRDKQGMLIEVRHTHYTINIKLPRWLGFGLVRPARPLVERVRW